MIILRQGANVSIIMRDGNCLSGAGITCKRDISFKETEVETISGMFGKKYRIYKYKEPYPIFDGSNVTSIEWETGGYNERIIE